MKREKGCQIAMKLVDIGAEYEHSATATVRTIRSNPEWSNSGKFPLEPQNKARYDKRKRRAYPKWGISRL